MEDREYAGLARELEPDEWIAPPSGDLPTQQRRRRRRAEPTERILARDVLALKRPRRAARVVWRPEAAARRGMGSAGEVLSLRRCQRPLHTARRLGRPSDRRLGNAAAAARPHRLCARPADCSRRPPSARAGAESACCATSSSFIAGCRASGTVRNSRAARHSRQDRRPALPPRPAGGLRLSGEPRAPHEALLDPVRQRQRARDAPPSTRPNGSRGRRSSAFVHEDPEMAEAPDNPGWRHTSASDLSRA